MIETFLSCSELCRVSKAALTIYHSKSPLRFLCGPDVQFQPVLHSEVISRLTQDKFVSLSDVELDLAHSNTKASAL